MEEMNKHIFKSKYALRKIITESVKGPDKEMIRITI